jgi:MSHA biogenesis protein MshO
MRHRQAAGFTLIEAIVVIAIMGILLAVVAVFIRAPVRGYTDAVGRAEVTDTADLALRRISRDLRRALPNSIRTTSDGHSIEFLLTRGGGRYLAADDGVADSSTTFALDFVNASNRQFTVVGAMPSLSTRVAHNDYVVVYNLGPDFAPADAYQFGSGNSNIALVDQPTIVSGVVQSISLQSNPFAVQSVPMPSPNQRFQVVSGPVTYRCASVNGVLTLTRYWGYAINATQADPPSGGSSAVVADRVDHCTNLFNYSGFNSTHRSGLVIMTLSLQARNGTDPAITLVDQVHVDNTP